MQIISIGPLIQVAGFQNEIYIEPMYAKGNIRIWLLNGGCISAITHRETTNVNDYSLCLRPHPRETQN